MEYKKVEPLNATNVVICPECSALVHDNQTSREHHAAWHDSLRAELPNRSQP